jgi:O-antigen/teichoic acid export membrane protein
VSRVKKNFVANLAGSGWIALSGLICTPLYIKFLGMEAYGLIGFFVMVQSIVQILDLGLSPTMNREMARYSVLPEKAGEARDFVRTLEAGYWAIGLLIGIVLLLCAPYIATSWIKTGNLPREEVIQAVRIMGVLSALQWPMSLYQGGLLGLQRQVLLNGIAITTTSLSSFGAILVLWRISPTITAFFTWQIGVSILQVLLTTTALWRCLPPSGRPSRINPSLVRAIGGFAAGVSGITLTALVLTQLDKIILSRVLPLKMFGYYVLACVVSNGLSSLVVAPMFNAVFPRLSSLVALKDDESIRQLYHGTCQLMATLVIPIVVVLSLFSYPIFLAWTGNPETAGNAYLVASFLVIGTGLNALLVPMYMLQLSHGWTTIGLKTNLLLILVLAPTLTVLAWRFGPTGAAFAWVITNALYMVVAIPMTHRRLLVGEAFPWLKHDVIPQLLCALPLAAALKSVIYWETVSIARLALIAGILLASMAFSALASSNLRPALMAQARKLFNRSQ